MTAVILVLLLIVIVAVVAFSSRRSAPSTTETDGGLNPMPLAHSNGDSVKESPKPQLDRATAEWAALRERAETDPAAAARVHEIIKAAIESTQRAVREPRGNSAVRSRLHQELATLWDDLAWANSRLRATAGSKPPPKK